MLDKNIVVGVTGGIAAYKSAELVRLLRKNGAQVRVVMTHNSREFITPLTMQTLSENEVATDLFNQNATVNLEHISLARFAHLIVIAPASANFIAKLTAGIADDLLTTTCLASTAKIVVVPAMNKEMWNAVVTQKNITELKNRGVLIFPPETGEQACGEIGFGRMMEPQKIVELIPGIFSAKILEGKKVVITAGPTQEPIDPVRYITNRSSGKMGYMLATAARDAGANVILISGPINHPLPLGINSIRVQTAQEMCDMVMKQIIGCDIFIAVAAVADYAPQNVFAHKIKKDVSGTSLELRCNPDILAKVASIPNPPITIGFAAETENILENAKAKLLHKKLNMIVASQVGDNTVFNSDKITATILDKSGEIRSFNDVTKQHLAKEIISKLA